jgi:hypothetical protein
MFFFFHRQVRVYYKLDSVQHRDSSEYNRKEQPLGAITYNRHNVKTTTTVESNGAAAATADSSSDKETETGRGANMSTYQPHDDEVFVYLWPDSTFNEITKALRTMTETSIGKALDRRGSQVIHTKKKRGGGTFICVKLFSSNTPPLSFMVLVAI